MRVLTESARASAMIKKELRKMFPNVDFKVKSKNYSGGDSVHVKWTDGVPTEKVKKLLWKYEDGYFDPMQDMYIYSKKEDNLPKAKYVLESRNMSDEVKQFLIKKHNKTWADAHKIKNPQQLTWQDNKFINDDFERMDFRAKELKAYMRKLLEEK